MEARSSRIVHDLVTQVIEHFGNRLQVDPTRIAFSERRQLLHHHAQALAYVIEDTRQILQAYSSPVGAIEIIKYPSRYSFGLRPPTYPRARRRCEKIGRASCRERV